MAFTTLIDPETLQAHLEDPDWVVVDCRFSLSDPAYGWQAYQKAHIPTAVYAHLDEDLSGPMVPGRSGRHPLPNPDQLAQKLGAWGIGSCTQVVAYDDAGGAFAARLWWLLGWLGHDAVAVLDGGWPRWIGEGRPIREGVEQRPPCAFTPRLQPERVVTADDVKQRLHDPAWRLLDARAPERYQGVQEPIDPVAGHIPGAVNAPFSENLTSAGTFLSPERLRQRFAALLGGVPPERTICYCGSGVTAAHNVLAMTHAGLPGARLYAGSWSEWITDPRRPVARGVR